MGLATNIDRAEVREIIRELEAGRRNPMETKKLLARTIVSEFWGDEAATGAEGRFERTVQRKEAPDEMTEFSPTVGRLLVHVLIDAGLTRTVRETRRLFEQGAVTVDGQRVTPESVARRGMIIQVGKRRWLRLV